MQFKVNNKFWIDLGLVGLLPLLAWFVFDDLTHGRVWLAAVICTVFLFNLYGSRRLLDFLLTGFCMWWIKRKAEEATRFIKSIKDEVSKNEKHY